MNSTLRHLLRTSADMTPSEKQSFSSSSINSSPSSSSSSSFFTQATTSPSNSSKVSVITSKYRCENSIHSFNTESPTSKRTLNQYANEFNSFLKKKGVKNDKSCQDKAHDIQEEKNEKNGMDEEEDENELNNNEKEKKQLFRHFDLSKPFLSRSPEVSLFLLFSQSLHLLNLCVDRRPIAISNFGT